MFTALLFPATLSFSILLYLHLGPVAWTSLKFKWQLRAFRVKHYVILNVILYAFYELRSSKLTFFVIPEQNDVKDNVMRDAKWSISAT